MSAALLSEIGRLSRERDLLERQRRRTLAGIDLALELLRRRPEQDDPDHRAARPGPTQTRRRIAGVAGSTGNPC